MRTAERKMELGLSTPTQGAWLRVVQGVFKGAQTVLRRILNRIAANGLTDMDDKQLADIGLTRSDVMNALDAGILEDPTTYLSKAAQLRARNRFARIRKA
jgi:uncharacterized protein YjiS (DUF1127 family)